jgi:hypothetical protein
MNFVPCDGAINAADRGVLAFFVLGVETGPVR